MIEHQDEKPPTDPGPVVPNYAITGGRTRSSGRELPVEALVTTTEQGRAQRASLSREYRLILETCDRPQSLVEISAVLVVPIGVARVLVSDLADADHLAVHLPLVDEDGRPRRELLERLLDGLRAR